MIDAVAIRNARRRLDESQSKFGLRFGVHQTTVHRWETDGPPQEGPVALLIANIMAALPRTKLGQQRQQLRA